MAQFAGKYTFVSQDNFDEWLKAAGNEIKLDTIYHKKDIFTKVLVQDMA